MALWKDPAPAPQSTVTPMPPKDLFPKEPDKAPVAAPQQESARRMSPRNDAKESVIAADLTIEGKIEGAGHIRIAGKFKGDVNVQGDLTIESGAKLSGGVRAKKVVIAGELEGNIEAASQVELLSSGVLVGDVKAGSLTVAAGSRMRGQADFGWDDGKAASKGGPASDAGKTGDAASNG